MLTCYGRWDSYILIITAWASALLVLLGWAMREPLCVERVTGTIPRFFIFSSNHFAWESAKTKNKRSMKRILSTVVMAMMLLMSFAQMPQTFSYQAVVRDAENNLVVSKPIVMELSILQGSDDGEVVYSEKHIVSTNSNGLISLEMGAGVSRDDFSAIDWSNAPYFVKTVAEFDGKTITGITPLLAVPYALYAAKAGNAEVDLTDYAKKSDIPESVDLSDYALKNEIPDVTNFITKDTLAQFALKNEISTQVDLTEYAKKSDIPESVDLSEYALKSEIPNTDNFVSKDTLAQYALKNEISIQVDLTDYAKKSDIPEIVDLSNYALKSEIPNTDNFVSKDTLAQYALKNEISTQVDLTDYAKKSDIPEAVDLSGYALKSEIPNTDNFVSKDTLAQYAMKSEIPTEVDLSDYAKISDIESTYAKKAEIPDSVNLKGYYSKEDVDQLLAALERKLGNGGMGDVEIIDGAIQAEFSVSDTKKVYFSQGNLQYKASTNTWRFAEPQYYFVGDDNANISETYEGWIDLFGWGTSGYNDRYPYMTSTTVTDYGDGTNDIAGTNYDWGVYNSISNGGNQVGLWRTLTINEWYYLIYSRKNASSKYGLATVKNVKGLILLPDDWTLPPGVKFKSGTGTGRFEQNTYFPDDWAKMESNGAVFLPAAGLRSRTNVNIDLNGNSQYWSGSADYGNNAHCLNSSSSNVRTDLSMGRDNGLPVRLVQDVE